MKRYLIIIPILLFIFLDACNNNSEISPAMSTAVVQTITAAIVTPTVTYTPMYITALSQISLDLNTAIESAEVSSKFDQLEHTIGSTYQVTDVNLVPNDTTPSSLELVVDCTCALNTNCCTPNRAFAITMAAMYAYQSDIEYQVPGTVNKLVVICLHDNSSVGSFSVSWYAVMNFLSDPANGYQLKSELTFVP
jgi:hypothetical protein